MEARRAHGESSIRQAADGRWDGFVSAGTASDGRRDRRHVRGKTRSEVVRKVRAVERSRDAGTLAGSGRTPTTGEWLDTWLTVASKSLRPTTLQGYRSKVDLYIRPVIGDIRLDRLQPEDVEAVTAAMGASGRAGATQLQTHRILSRALKVAVQRGRVSRNVATLVDAPTIQHTEVKPLDAVEARAVLAAAKGTRNAARWSVAVGLGLRQGEALALRWDDVDLERGALTVRHSLARLSGRGLVLGEPKSKASRRTIAMPAALTVALKAHRKAQTEERLLAANTYQDGGFVFAQQNGRPIDPGADWKSWKRLLAKAGVRDVRLHDARHCAATLLLVQGVPVRVVAGLLGHGTPALTAAVYQHLMPELEQAAAQAMDAALFQ